MQRSYKDLTGQDVPGAEPFSPVMVKVEPSPITIEPVMEMEGVVNEEGEPIRTSALSSVGVGWTQVLLLDHVENGQPLG